MFKISLQIRMEFGVMPSSPNGIERTSCKGRDSRWCAISLRQRHKVSLSKYSYWQVCSEVFQYQNWFSEAIKKKKRRKKRSGLLESWQQGSKQ